MSEGKIIVISGFSGVGKGTVIGNLMKKYPDDYTFSVSATTRLPRQGEIDGKDYYFISTLEFESMIKAGELLEYAKYGDNYYGTPIAPIDKLTKEGKNVILDIEVNGMHNVIAKRSDALTAFIIPPSAKTLIDRLTGRGTETKEQIYKRLKRAIEENIYIRDYRCVLMNDDIEKCTLALEKYIADEIVDEDVRKDRIELAMSICKDLKDYIDKGDILL